MSLPRVMVLMATYNGEKYLKEQIDSILAQEGVAVQLWISDDRSTDSTQDICARYARNHPNITFTINSSNKGCTDNFLGMVHSLRISDFDYLSFSDQDDIWKPDKLSQAVSMLRHAQDSPCLYYSDVTNYDFENDTLVNGGDEYRPFASCAHNLKSLLCANWASGNTMVMNKSLAELLQKYYPTSFRRYHDTWVHLVALSCGQTVADLENSHVIRRISGDNEVGLRNFGTFNKNRLKGILKTLFDRNSHDLTDAAKSLLAGYGCFMAKDDLEAVTLFAESAKHPMLRIRVVRDRDFRLPSKIDTLMARGKILLGKA